MAQVTPQPLEERLDAVARARRGPLRRRRRRQRGERHEEPLPLPGQGSIGDERAPTSRLRTQIIPVRRAQIDRGALEEVPLAHLEREDLGRARPVPVCPHGAVPGAQVPSVARAKGHAGAGSHAARVGWREGERLPARGGGARGIHDAPPALLRAHEVPGVRRERELERVRVVERAGSFGEGEHVPRGAATRWEDGRLPGGGAAEGTRRERALLQQPLRTHGDELTPFNEVNGEFTAEAGLRDEELQAPVRVARRVEALRWVAGVARAVDEERHSLARDDLHLLRQDGGAVTRARQGDVVERGVTRPVIERRRRRSQHLRRDRLKGLLVRGHRRGGCSTWGSGGNRRAPKSGRPSWSSTPRLAPERRPGRPMRSAPPAPVHPHLRPESRSTKLIITTTTIKSATDSLDAAASTGKEGPPSGALDARRPP